MNKIYRLIWNRELGQLVVASELARAGTVAGGRIGTHRPMPYRAGLALAILFGLGASSAWAADVVCVDAATGAPIPAQQAAAAAAAGNQVICGDGAIASGEGAIAVGQQASATADHATAIGTSAAASGVGSNAIGRGAKAPGPNTIAIGTNADTTVWAPIAENGQPLAGRDAIAIGQNSRAGNNFSTAIGFSARANQRFGIAIGSGARVDWDGTPTLDRNASSIAIGHNAYVAYLANGGIAIGNGAGVDSGNPNIAIGSGARGIGTLSIAMGINSRGGGDTAMAIGAGAQTDGFDSIALGPHATAGRYQNGNGVMSATAVGAGAVAQGRASTALGAGSIVFGQGSASLSSNSPLNARFYDDPKDNTAFSVIGGRNNFSIGNHNAIGDTSNNNLAIGNDILIGTTGVSFVQQTKSGGSANDLRYFVPTYQGRVAINNAIAVGQAAHVGASDTVALGSASQANNANDVALGSGSSTSAPVATAGGSVGGIDYAYAGTNPGSTVSIGSAGAERQLQKVAAGQVSATSTDAINGSQLFATQTAIGNLAQSSADNFGGGVVVNPDGSLSAPSYVTTTGTYSNVGDALVANNQQTNVLGASVAAGLGGSSTYDPVTGSVTTALTVGGTTYNDVNSALNAINALAGAGWHLQANGGAATDIQPGSSVNVVDGSNTRVTLNGNELKVDVVDAPTFAGQVTMNGGFVVGANQLVDMGGNVIRNVGAGDVSATSTDAVNGSQLYQTNQAVQAVDDRVTNLAGDVSNLGSRVDANEINISAIQQGAAGMFQVNQPGGAAPAPTGTNSAAGGSDAVASGDNSTAVGNQSVASGNNSTALGQGAVASGNSSIAIGAGSTAVEDNVVSVGSIGAERRITNVAPGVNGTDAVNLNQLQGMSAGGVQYDKNADGSVNYNSVTLNPGGSGPATIHNVAAGVAPTDAVNVGQLNAGLTNTLNEANAYTDARLIDINNDIWTMRKDFRGATASAMAMAGLPQAYLPGKSMLAAGVGGYQGQYGIAVGLSGITENGKWVYKAQASGNTASDWGFSAGIGIQW
ncbi:YadA-like family protein [Luteimonas sp. e5]